jgi:hypothetical protein
MPTLAIARNEACEEETPIFTVKRVQDSHRMTFMPRAFPGFYMAVENSLFNLANRGIPVGQYSGYFHFETISFGDGSSVPLFHQSVRRADKPPTHCRTG